MSTTGINSVVGVGGLVAVGPPVLSGKGAPSSSFKGQLGQMYYDKSAIPFIGYTWNGSSWETSGTTPVDQFTGNSGVAVPAGGNLNILGSGTVSTSGSGDAITITASEGGYPITPYVVGPSGQAGYQTIQTAINAANAAGGGLVFIQPGTYTEDLTLYSNVSLGGSSPTLTFISGTHTPPSSGNVDIFRCALVDSSAIFSSAVAGSTQITIEDCTLNITNGFSFNLASWTGSLKIVNSYCIGANDGFINNIGGCSLSFYNSTIGNGSLQTLLTSGIVLWEGCRINCPINMQTGSSFTIDVTQFYSTLTLSNNSTGSITSSKFVTGSNASVTMSSSGSVSITGSTVNSSHDPCITGSGAGTLTITNTSLTSNYNIADTLTVSSKNIRGGNFLSQYVVANDGTAPYDNIQSAMDAAYAYYTDTTIPQTVYVKPGEYTEDLTFYVGVDLCAAGGQVDSEFTHVIGTHVLPSADGSTAIYGIWFTGETACFTGSSGITKVNMFNVITEITGTGYTFDIDGYSGELNIFDYLQYDGGVNGFVYNPTGGAEVNIIFAGIGLSQTLSAVAQISGNSFFQGMLVSISMNFVGSSYTQLNMGCELQGTISTEDSASIDIANTYCFVGSAPAINHGSSGEINLSNVGINTSANPAIAGSGIGAINLASVSFLDSSVIATTLTLGTSARTVSGGFKTANESTNLTVSGQSIAAGGTSADVDVNITPKGSGDVVATAGSIIASAGQLHAGADTGGVASTIAITNGNSTTIGAGNGTIKMSSGNSATNTAWIKIYVGTTAYWIPAWTTNSP